MNTIDNRLVAVKELTEIFRVERFVYLVGASIALVAVIVVLAMSIFHNGANVTDLGVLLSSGGLFAATGNRVITMWAKAMDAVLRAGG